MNRVTFIHKAVIFSLLSISIFGQQSSLRQNLKLKTHLNSQNSEDLSSIRQEQVQDFAKQTGSEQQNTKFNLKADDDPVFVEYKKPFTATPYYDYLDNFLLGLKIETTITTSGDCIDSLVYTIDDYTYFLNNLTDFKKKSWEAPFLNLSRAIGGNFSFVPLRCYVFGLDFQSSAKKKLDSFDDNVGNFILAFLFNLMGNSLKFRQAAQDIENDKKNQFYVDIAQQYGKILRLILSFDASDLTEASLSPHHQALADVVNQMFKDKSLLKINRLGGRKVARAMRKMTNFNEQISQAGGLNHLLEEYAINHFANFLGQDPKVLQQKILELRQTVLFAKFNGYSDALLVGQGIISGMIDVLPDESFLSYCKGNSSSIYNSGKTMNTELSAGKQQDGFTALQEVLEYSAGVTFNCFYSVRDPTALSQQSYGFGPTIIAWNVLYNLGYMYSDAKKVVDISQSSTAQWKLLGEKMGDFIMRFFYSRYIPRSART